MLLEIMLVLSAVSAVATGFATDAFSSLSWLWVLPLTAAGSFLVLLLLAFVFLLIVCARIDPDQPRDEDIPWFRRMVMWYIKGILQLLPIRIRTRGLEKTPKQGRFLLVCNHLDNIDPAFLYRCFPDSQLAFVAKKEVREMFLVGKVLPVLLGQLVNRENDREALRTIVRCIQLIKEDKASVAIFPEGRVNDYRKLAHFRPGVFKIAQKANVPIVVCTIQNTQNVIPRLKKLRGSTVEVHLLTVIPPEQLANRSTVEIAEQIYGLMARDLGPENVLTPEEEENT